ncbi:hypothetical protein O4J55_28365 [Paracoccus sp. PXZ]
MGFLLVFVGSGIGGMACHGVGVLALRWLGPNFSIGTLTINIAGSFLMGAPDTGRSGVGFPSLCAYS